MQLNFTFLSRQRVNSQCNNKRLLKMKIYGKTGGLKLSSSFMWQATMWIRCLWGRATKRSTTAPSMQLCKHYVRRTMDTRNTYRVGHKTGYRRSCRLLLQNPGEIYDRSTHICEIHLKDVLLGQQHTPSSSSEDQLENMASSWRSSASCSCRLYHSNRGCVNLAH